MPRQGHVWEKENSEFWKVQFALPLMKHVDHFKKVNDFLFWKMRSLCHITIQEHLDCQKASSAVVKSSERRWGFFVEAEHGFAEVRSHIVAIVFSAKVAPIGVPIALVTPKFTPQIKSATSLAHPRSIILNQGWKMSARFLRSKRASRHHCYWILTATRFTSSVSGLGPILAQSYKTVLTFLKAWFVWAFGDVIIWLLNFY